MNTADRIAEWLEQKDIRHGFGIIGGGNVALFEAIAKRGFTALVPCHHEQAAAMAASFYYRACGRLAVCLVTTGAGSSNAITGVLAAWMDSIPLLVISGNEASKYMGADTRILGVQGYDSTRLVRPIVKIALRPPQDVPQHLSCAYNAMFAGRHGPAWVDIPKDIQNAAVL